jgi:hypothetical protein
MTTDDLQLLREFRAEIPAPDEETRRRIYAYATNPAPSRWHEASRRLSVPPLHLRFAVPAVAAISATAVAAVVFAGALGGSSGTSTRNASDVVLGLTITPDSTQAGSSVGEEIGSSFGVEMKTVVPDASAPLELQVLRKTFPPGTDPNNFDPTTEPNQVVFTETVPMTVVQTGPATPGNWNHLATWSGRLSVSDWTGGCQRDSVYAITARVLDTHGVPAVTDGSNWLTCKPEA